jgi:uncharacterized protein YjdB
MERRRFARKIGFGTLLLLTACADGTSPVAVASIQILSAPEELIEGRTVVLGTRVMDTDGKEVAGPAIRWYSSNAEVAAVSFEGEVFAVTPGSATITATIGSVAASVPIEVVLTPIDRVELDLSTGYVRVGEVHGTQLLAWDIDGAPVTDRQVEWSVSDTTIATIRPSTLTTAEVFGRRPGQVTVTATLGGVSASGLMWVSD